MFILNLFAGVVIENFNRQKDKLCGYVMMTKEQKSWVEMQRFMLKKGLKSKRVVPEEACRRFFYNIVTTKSFDIVIFTSIVVNTIMMSLRYFDMPVEYRQALDAANYFFVAIFNIECLMKLIAYGRFFTMDMHNLFDLGVVIVADFGIIFKYTYSSSGDITTAATVLRTFKVISLVRVFKNSSTNLKVIIDTLLYILPTMANIGSLIILILFIYSILGMRLFAYVMNQDAINDQVNFRSFGKAFMLLLSCATGESWNDLMWEFANQDGYKGVQCINDQTYDQMMALGGPEVGVRECGSNASFVYFITFMINVSIMIMNLFIAVVVEGFSSSVSLIIVNLYSQKRTTVWLLLIITTN